MEVRSRRYPAVYRFATQELDQIGNRPRLLAKNPVLAPIARIFEEQKAFIDEYPLRLAAM